MNNQKNKGIFLLTIVIFGIVLGIIFANVLNETDQQMVTEKIMDYFTNIKDNISIDYKNNFFNTFYQNAFTAILIGILGLSIVGLCSILILFYKGFIIGFSIGSIISIYLYKGILLSIVYIFPHLIINILVFMVLSYYSISFSLRFFKVLFLKKDLKLHQYLRKYLQIFGGGLIVLVITTVLETFLSPILIKTFTFLLN